MATITKSMTFILSGALFIAADVMLPLSPVFGEGGARRDVVRHAAEFARAESAGPSSLSKNATILDGDGNVLRKGTNGWTCMPDNPNTPGTDSMCMNEPWLNFRDARKNKTKPTYTQVGIAYMMQGDSPVSNTDPFAKTPKPGDDWVEGLGAHIMVLIPDVETLKNLSTDSKNGGPWVMWANTPYAHLMIPIDSYPSP
ncbi:MAG: hypothetical protein HXY51_11825 [Nitrospirae bacterium]|nr:hypothetical protein [Nitrospirota bacterium]